MKNLFKTNHPYYMSEGNYFSNDCHHEYDSFESFLEEWGDADIEYNRVHRFDWEKDEDSDEYTLKIYFVLQRKANLNSCFIKVTPQENEKVYKYLKPHYQQTLELWKEFK